MKLLVDSWAWIELVSAGPLNRKTADMMKGKTLLTTTANLYELRLHLLKHQPEKAEQITQSIIAQCEYVVPLTQDIALAAADIKARAKKDVGAVDCLTLAAARLHADRILSGDPHFQDYPNVDFIH